MKIACVLINHFALQQELRRHPELRGRSVIVYLTSGSERSVLDYSPQLESVHRDMPLSEAISKVKSANLIKADIPYYNREFEYILDSLENKSPVVEPADLGCAYVGLDGLEGLYGSEAQMIDALLDLPEGAEGARVGVADGKFPALLVARGSTPERPQRISGDSKSFLMRFSVEVLPVSCEVKARLHSFGLDTLGQIASLDPTPLQSQFGTEGLRIWELSNGIDETPVVARKEEDAICESLTFSIPVITMEPLLVAVEVLLSRAFSLARMRDRYVRIFTLKGQVVDGSCWMHRMSFREPVANRRRAFLLVKGSLMSCTPPGPLESLQVTLSSITGDSGHQLGIFSDVRRMDQLRYALAQLEARLGRRAPVYMVRDLEPWSRIPERWQCLIQYAP